MPQGMPLVLNLDNDSYCEIVYGEREPEKIAERFSRLDPKRVAKLMKTWQGEKISARLTGKLERLASLPRQVARFLSVAVGKLQAET